MSKIVFRSNTFGKLAPYFIQPCLSNDPKIEYFSKEKNRIFLEKSCFNGTISFIRSKEQLIFEQFLSFAAKTVYPINHWLTIDCSSNKTLMWILFISQRLKVVCHLFAITGFLLNHIIMCKFRNTWMLNISVNIFNKGKQFEWFQNLQQKLIIGHLFVIRNYISVVVIKRIANWKSLFNMPTWYMIKCMAY